MLRFLKSFFHKATPPVEPAVPYKVEAPVPAYDVAPQPEPAKCGCGRSQTGLCVGLHKLTPDEWASHESNPNAVKPAPVAKKAPAKKSAAKKPAAITASAKPRAPRKPRSAK